MHLTVRELDTSIYSKMWEVRNYQPTYMSRDMADHYPKAAEQINWFINLISTLFTPMLGTLCPIINSFCDHVPFPLRPELHPLPGTQSRQLEVQDLIRGAKPNTPADQISPNSTNSSSRLLKELASSSRKRPFVQESLPGGGDI